MLCLFRMKALAAAGDRDLWLLCVRPHDTEEHQPDKCMAQLMLESVRTAKRAAARLE